MQDTQYYLVMKNGLKRTVKKTFNVPMNYNDWLKIFELIGTYLLYKINNVFIVEI